MLGPVKLFFLDLQNFRERERDREIYKYKIHIKTMKHIKLFENFSQIGQDPALIVATGDWTGITQTGEAVDFTTPMVINVTYYANPTPEQISQVQNIHQQFFYDEADIWSPEDAVTEIMSGDQGGTNLFKDNQEGLTILIDKSEGPEEIERKIQETLDIINEGGDTGADQFTSVLEDPDAKNIYTPEYLAHCRACLELDELGQNYVEKYPLPAGNAIGPQKLMKRRVNFNVV